MRSSRIRDTLSYMTDDTKAIADRVRGIAAEKRLTQQGVGNIIGLDRKSVGARYEGRVAFTGVEILRLARATGVDVHTFFPSTPTAPVPAGSHPSPGAGVLSSSPTGSHPKSGQPGI